MITAIVCLIIGACIGAVGMGILAGRRDADCETCDALKNAQAECWELERKLHGMRSSNGRLGKELQAMAFRQNGYKAR